MDNSWIRDENIITLYMRLVVVFVYNRLVIFNNVYYLLYILFTEWFCDKSWWHYVALNHRRHMLMYFLFITKSCKKIWNRDEIRARFVDHEYWYVFKVGFSTAPNIYYSARWHGMKRSETNDETGEKNHTATMVSLRNASDAPHSVLYTATFSMTNYIVVSCRSTEALAISSVRHHSATNGFFRSVGKRATQMSDYYNIIIMYACWRGGT